LAQLRGTRGRAACGPTRLASGSGAADGAMGMGPRASEEGGNSVRGVVRGGGGRTDRSRPPVRFRGDSPSWFRFRVVGEVV
jgi:hypothetical protein